MMRGGKWVLNDTLILINFVSSYKTWIEAFKGKKKSIENVMKKKHLTEFPKIILCYVISTVHVSYIGDSKRRVKRTKKRRKREKM